MVDPPQQRCWALRDSAHDHPMRGHTGSPPSTRAVTMSHLANPVDLTTPLWPAVAWVSNAIGEYRK
jgi:hypothetical protein